MDAATLLEKTHEVLDARQVIGQPFEKNGTTVIPVATVRGGGRGGSGEPGDGTPGGAGARVRLAARPIGAFVLRDDKVRWLPAVDVNRVILGGQVVAVVALLVVRSIVRTRAKAARAEGHVAH